MYHLTTIVVREEKGGNVITCNIQVFIICYKIFMIFSIRLVNLWLLYFIGLYLNMVHFWTLFVKLNSVSWRFSILQNILYLYIFNATKDIKLLSKLVF